MGTPDGSASLTFLFATGEIPELRRMRADLARFLPGLTETELNAVQLVCTELVTNAYEHGRGPIRAEVVPVPGAVGVRVHDTGPGTPVLGRSRLGALRGRGLLLVRHVASEWGSKPDDTGKTVWATVAVGPRRLAEPTAGAGGEPAG